MDRPEMINLFRIAHDEIITLRRHNAELAPKAHAYDTLAAVARLKAETQGEGYGIDVAWRLKEAVDSLTAEREAERAVADAAAVAEE